VGFTAAAAAAAAAAAVKLTKAERTLIHSCTRSGVHLDTLSRLPMAHVLLLLLLLLLLPLPLPLPLSFSCNPKSTCKCDSQTSSRHGHRTTHTHYSAYNNAPQARPPTPRGSSSGPAAA
jgi:hypothetical protein